MCYFFICKHITFIPLKKAPGKRKRTLAVFEPDLEPMRKNLKVASFKFNITEIDEPQSYSFGRWKDVAWTLSCKSISNTPVWSGWNSVFTSDPLPPQTVGYMQNIGLPPTRSDVVKETVTQSLKVTDECGEKYIPITYDLGIAKPALQLQDSFKPKFYRAFVMFGAFHIMYRCLEVLGYYLDGSGADSILVESGALAKGSVNGCLLGRLYNRGKRLHVLLATALRMKHQELFLSQQGNQEMHVGVITAIGDLLKNPSESEYTKLEAKPEFVKLMSDYFRFFGETLGGIHGSPAKYWEQYIALVDIYLVFSRAV